MSFFNPPPANVGLQVEVATLQTDTNQIVNKLKRAG